MVATPANGHETTYAEKYDVSATRMAGIHIAAKGTLLILYAHLRQADEADIDGVGCHSAYAGWTDGLHELARSSEAHHANGADSTHVEAIP